MRFLGPGFIGGCTTAGSSSFLGGGDLVEVDDIVHEFEVVERDGGGLVVTALLYKLS